MPARPASRAPSSSSVPSEPAGLVSRACRAFVVPVVGAFLLVRFRRRAALPLLGALLVGGLLVAAYPPLRERARFGLSLYRQGDWNTLLSYRGGPWAASLEMIRERPLSGFGPGTFGAEYVPHRLAAEIRARR